MYAKSAAAPRTDANSVAGTIHDPKQRQKWDLQRAAQGILRETKPKVDRFGNDRVAYVYRVAMCHRGTDGVAPEVRRSRDGERASFFGVQTCGSVWHCPICAPKIANGRRDEMAAAMSTQIENGGMVFLLTYTFQHGTEDGGAGCLKPQLDKLREAMREFKALRAYKAIMERAGSIGQVRALEVTYGEANGWHPHVHELCFAAKSAVVTRIIGRVAGFTDYGRSILGRLRTLWARHLIKNGMAGLTNGDTGIQRFAKLRHLMTRCFTVQCGAFSAQYIAKFGREAGGWGLSDELTKSHTKMARRVGHTTPWGLLMDHLEGDKRATWLFREYAEAFAGKRQLFWSRGLKKELGIAEVEDDDLAAAPDQRCDETVIRLTDDQWRVILSRNARYDVLRAAARDGKPGVLVLLRELAEAPSSFSDAYTENGRAFAPIARHQ
jgi:hypothetical protein